MDAIVPDHHAIQTLRALISRIRKLMTERGAHAARTVVLLPYIHLVPVARKVWARNSRRILPSG